MSNLLHHLCCKHALEYQKCIILKGAPSTSSHKSDKANGQANQTSLFEVFAKGTVYDRKNKQWIEITNAIAIRIAKL